MHENNVHVTRLPAGCGAAQDGEASGLVPEVLHYTIYPFSNKTVFINTHS
jgi:hypothetical protein